MLWPADGVLGVFGRGAAREWLGDVFSGSTGRVCRGRCSGADCHRARFAGQLVWGGCAQDLPHRHDRATASGVLGGQRQPWRHALAQHRRYSVPAFRVFKAICHCVFGHHARSLLFARWQHQRIPSQDGHLPGHFALSDLYPARFRYCPDHPVDPHVHGVVCGSRPQIYHRRANLRHSRDRDCACRRAVPYGAYSGCLEPLGRRVW